MAVPQRTTVMVPAGRDPPSGCDCSAAYAALFLVKESCLLVPLLVLQAEESGLM